MTTHKWSRVPAVSLDGRYPFFLKVVNADGALNLFRVPLAGGDEEKVLESVDTYNLCRDGIVFKYCRPGPNPDGPRLQFYRLATAETAHLGEPSKPLRYGVAASPDCRYVGHSSTARDSGLPEGVQWKVAREGWNTCHL